MYKKLKPEYKHGHNYTSSGNLLKVGGLGTYVGPDESLEILIFSEEGFSVFIPHHGVFNSQVFEAEEEPAWATAKDKQEAKDAAGERSKIEGINKSSSTEGGSDEGAESAWATNGKFWGVRMDRISKRNGSPVDEMPYCIYSKQDNTFAVGNSPPTMIVKP